MNFGRLNEYKKMSLVSRICLMWLIFVIISFGEFDRLNATRNSLELFLLRDSKGKIVFPLSSGNMFV